MNRKNAATERNKWVHAGGKKDCQISREEKKTLLNERVEALVVAVFTFLKARALEWSQQ